MMRKIDWCKVDSKENIIHDGISYTEYRACPVCEKRGEFEVLNLNQFQFYTDSNEVSKRADIKTVRCAHCSAVFMNPVYSPGGFRELFREAGQSYGSTEGRPFEQVKWLSDRGLLVGGANLLDIGCYEGRFLSLIPNSVHRIGVDIDENAIRSGMEKYGEEGISLICGAFDQFNVPPDLTVITMFHVLEHLPYPIKVLNHLRDSTNSDVRLVIEVPIIENHMNDDINGLLSVQHTTHFTKNSFSNLLTFCGWGIIEFQLMSEYNGFRVVCRKGGGKIKDVSQDLLYLNSYLSSWFSALAQAASKITAWPLTKRSVIWGAGAHTEFLYHLTPYFLQAPDREYILVDSDLLKHGKTWRGINIYSPSVLSSLDWSSCDLVLSTYGSQEKIADAAVNLGVPIGVLRKIYGSIHVY